MTGKEGDNRQVERPTHRVHLPGFVADEDIGLGDVVKRMTYAIGIRPCGGCEARAAALNSWIDLFGQARQVAANGKSQFSLEEAMDQNEVAELSASSAASEVRPSQGAVDTGAPAQPAPCPTCGGVAGSPASYVYALGQIETRFPRPSVEKEVAQATGRAETAGQTDRQAFQRVLSQRENRYLARQLCWVLTVQGLETYILQPRDPADLDLLIGALHDPPDPVPWISTVIGLRGPVAPPEYCNGLMIPIVAFDQIYTFSKDALIEAIPRPEGIPAARFGPAARELFDTIMQMTDNAGASDEHRALNYLVRALSHDLRQGGRSVRRRSWADRRWKSVPRP